MIQSNNLTVYLLFDMVDVGKYERKEYQLLHIYATKEGAGLGMLKCKANKTALAGQLVIRKRKVYE